MPTKPKQPDENEAQNAVVVAATGAAPRDGDQISRYINREEQDREVTAAQTQAAIIHRIIQSADVDSVLELFEPETLADFENRVIRIDDFRWNESDFDQGPPVYASIMVVDKDAQTRHLINSGEQRIMAQLWKLQDLNAFPVEVRVVLSKRPNRYGKRLAAFTKPEGVNG